MKIIEKITESVFFKNLINKINDLIDNSNELGGKVEFLEKIDTSKFEYLDRIEEIDNKVSKTELNNVVTIHNTNVTAHSDIRLLIQDLSTRLNALADSDDVTLDQMSEIVAYIKANKSLIESITTNKVNISDIIDNLETNVSNKPLSAGQGVVLKQLVDSINLKWVTPEMFGAKGDGVSDDTQSFEKMLETNRPMILNGNYFLYSSIVFTGNIFSNSAKIILGTNSIKTRGVCNFYGTLEVEHNEQESMKHTIQCINDSKVLFEDLTISNSQGDGIYINTSDVIIKKLHIKKAKRNGISLVHGKLDGENILIENVSGYSPELGIDIESNNPDEITVCNLRNIEIKNTNGPSFVISKNTSDCTLNIENAIFEHVGIYTPYKGGLRGRNITMIGKNNKKCFALQTYRNSSDPNETEDILIPYFDFELYFKKVDLLEGEYYGGVSANKPAFNGRIVANFDNDIENPLFKFRNFSETTNDNILKYESNIPNSLVNTGDRATLI